MPSLKTHPKPKGECNVMRPDEARRMKEGRNPKTGATVSVPAKKVPFFKAGKELKDLLNK